MQVPDAASQLEPLLRLAAALVLGAAVGLERELQRMPAGFRTHALVGLGSAIFTVVSAYAFPGPISDPTRIAAQIVTGVGFLGGGAILHYRGSVRGLTTAASLWAVAAIGMAAGAGLYVIAVGGAVLVVTTLYVLDRLEAWVRRRWGRANQSNVDEQPDGRTEDMP
ncbi:MAG TPA: MgtC/SapB family protein [Candidatus Limnocylindria bacterium]|jgi:putative Mg2+ transporter-C (MgtC) family protein|nr:MgtC/SapB family protein [Candidatus Limnocylindria bacterium]